MVLVAVHADGQLAGVLGRLVDAHAGAAGRGEDDVRALGELGLGQFTAAGRVIPGGRGGARHVREHLDLGVGRLGALLVAALEFADQRNVHAADEADLVGLGGQRGHRADQIAALMLLEQHRLHIGQVDLCIDDRELGLGEVLGHLLQRRGLGKADADDGAGALLGHAADGLHALRVVADLELEIGLAGLLLPLLGTGIAGLVEGFVELAAHVEDHRGLLGLGQG
mmetsp:Transcript_26286/g.62295  ORF Transcript_26286/g.62295 Transcript_26286/m.62295 type:complete len:225 (+) Transcript_26286:421-1095(+)